VAPLPDGLAPTKVIAVHLNYHSRAAQRGRTPSEPSYFLKPVSSLSPGGDVVRPQGAELLAYEGEIAVIIGRPARGVRDTPGVTARWTSPPTSRSPMPRRCGPGTFLWASTCRSPARGCW
jgi:Fumarylacetoacetate (FAA) hydrolase family